MVKIHITGNSGSGKTTFAARLGAALNLPVFGLDKIVWQAGWVKTPQNLRLAKEADLIAQDRWIIEGVSARVRHAADVIIFLDVSRYVCFKRGVLRTLRYFFRTRPELPEGCPDILILRKQIEIIWKFKTHARPQILDDLEAHHGKIFIVRTQADIDAVWDDIIASVRARS